MAGNTALASTVHVISAHDSQSKLRWQGMCLTCQLYKGAPSMQKARALPPWPPVPSELAQQNGTTSYCMPSTHVHILISACLDIHAVLGNQIRPQCTVFKGAIVYLACWVSVSTVSHVHLFAAKRLKRLTVIGSYSRERCTAGCRAVATAEVRASRRKRPVA